VDGNGEQIRVRLDVADTMVEECESETGWGGSF